MPLLSGGLAGSWDCPDMVHALSVVPGHPAGQVEVTWAPKQQRVHFDASCPTLRFTEAHPERLASVAPRASFCDECDGPAIDQLEAHLGDDPFTARYWLDHAVPWLTNTDRASAGARHQALLGLRRAAPLVVDLEDSLPSAVVSVVVNQVQDAVAAQASQDAYLADLCELAANSIATAKHHNTGPFRGTRFDAWEVGPADVAAAEQNPWHRPSWRHPPQLPDRAQAEAWLARVTRRRVWLATDHARGCVSDYRAHLADADVYRFVDGKAMMRVPELLHPVDRGLLPDRLHPLDVSDAWTAGDLETALRTVDSVTEVTDELLTAVQAATTGCPA